MAVIYRVVHFRVLLNQTNHNPAWGFRTNSDKKNTICENFFVMFSDSDFSNSFRHSIYGQRSLSNTLNIWGLHAGVPRIYYRVAT